MSIFDQYEVEPASVCSGSYTDNVNIGSIFNNYPANMRSVIASRVSGIKSQNLINKSISRNQFQSYKESSYNGSVTKNLNININSNEYIYDSLVPSAGGIIIRDGNQLPYLNFTYPDTSTGQMFSNFVPSNESLQRMPVYEDSINCFFTPNGFLPSAGSVFFPIADFVDNNWIFNFPFQSKYKNLQRTSNNIKAIESLQITKNLLGVSLSTPITTMNIGSIFYGIKDLDEYKVYTSYSQLWSMTSSFATPVSDATTQTMNHVPLSSYNGLQKIYYNNYKAVNVSSSYALFGENETIITSSNGINWNTITSRHNSTDVYQSPYDIPIQISSWGTDATGSIRFGLPVGYQISGNNGNHYQWLLLIGKGLSGTKLVRNTTKGQPNLTTNSPTKNNWQYVNLDSGVTVDLYGLIDLDPGGTKTVALSSQTICAFGTNTTPNPDQGYIAFSNKDATTFTQNTSANAIANNVTWLSADHSGDFSGTTRIYFCGYNNGIYRTGQVGVISYTTATQNPATQTLNNVTSIVLAAIPALPRLPITRAIAHNPITGTTILVGDGGLIMRCTDRTLTTSWTLCVPASSFTKSFVDVKLRYGSTDQGDWIIVGDDGTIQYSTNDGLAWYSGNTEQPHISGGIGTSIVNISDKIPYGSSYRSFYAGSREKYINSSLKEPQYMFGVGGKLEHSFNSGGTNNTILITKIADASGSNTVNLNLMQSPNIIPGDYGADVRPLAIEYNKAFFGFGDGISIDLTPYQYGGPVNAIGSKGRSPSVTDFTLYDLYGSVKEPAQILIHKLGIRGWKYGLTGYSLKTGLVYRRNKFGQIRDMLEGRVTTATLLEQGTNPYGLPIQRTVFYPIDVTFVTGSEIYTQAKDYVSATNPSYNPYDSGIYDYHYRSGQPFTDR